MGSFTAPMKVDPLLKENFLALRDALATLTTDQAQRILEAAIAQTTTPVPTALEASPTPPSSNAVLVSSPDSNAELSQGERLLLMSRPVPTALVGTFTRLLDEAQADPGRVRAALIQATKFL